MDGSLDIKHMIMILDLTFLLYVFQGIIATWGVVLFILGWIRTGRASATYIYLTLMMAGMAVDKYIMACARYAFCSHGPGSLQHTMILDSSLWEFRLWIPLLSLTMIVGHFTLRYLRETRWIQHNFNPLNLYGHLPYWKGRAIWRWYEWFWKALFQRDAVL